MRAPEIKEEIKLFAQDYKAKHPCESLASYWEDVKVGDKLTPIVKGPLTTFDLMAYFGYISNLSGTFEVGYRNTKGSPMAGRLNPATN